MFIPISNDFLNGKKPTTDNSINTSPEDDRFFEINTHYRDSDFQGADLFEPENVKKNEEHSETNNSFSDNIYWKSVSYHSHINENDFLSDLI
jgi:hypothetical protein